MNKTKTIIIVPAFNEEEVIGGTLETLIRLKQQVDHLEICVVNDGSTDNTKQIIEQYPVVQIHLPQNLGIGGAVQTGYKYAYRNNYDIAVQFDADGQHNAEDLFRLIRPILNDEADMVIGSRFLTRTHYKGSKLRRIGIYYFYVILKMLTRQKFTDPTSGYRAINRNVLEIFVNRYPKDYPEPEVLIQLHKSGLRMKEIPAYMKERQGGKSSISSWRSIYYMAKVTLSIFMQKIERE